MRRFEDQVALVTGAGHGIGRASALRLAREGADVAVLDLSGEAAEETAALAAREGARTMALECDVADEEAVAAAVNDVLERFGRIDVLHSNAGVLIAGDAESATLDEWERTFAVNVRGAFLVSRAVLPAMRAQGKGAIVATASTSGIAAEPAIAAYCASKAAVIQLTRQLAVDYSRHGIRVNCVCPGWVDTGFNDPILVGVSETELAEVIDRTVPLGRQGTPEEIAAVVAFLASDDASVVTGHALVADGGLTAR